MRKLKGMAFVLLIVVFISSILFISACTNTSTNNKAPSNDQINIENEDTIKEINHTLFLSYELGDSYNTDGKIAIQLFLGTDKERSYLQNYYWGYKQPLDEIMTISICAFIQNDQIEYVRQDIVYGNVDVDILELITIDDFCMENYPYPNKEIKAKSVVVEIPQNLFLGQNGQIMIWVEFLDVYVSVELNYTIVNNVVTIVEV